MAKLTPDNSALLVIDWQERLFPAMPEGLRDKARDNAGNLVWLAGELDVPVLASEQYPRGLGPTLAEVPVTDPVAKTEFSACQNAEFAERLAGIDADNIVVCGMETHICVAQTCRDLADAGKTVWLVADACLSRRKLDWELGVERVRADGGRPVTTEAVLFEWMGKAGGPVFKELSRRIK